MTKRRHPGSPTINAAGDKDDGDWVDVDPPNYEHGFSKSSHAVSDLEKDILRFEKHSKVPEDLDWHVYSPVSTQILWYKKLLKAWKESAPVNSNQATKLVHDILRTIPPYDHIHNIEGFLYFYGLPHHYSVISSTLSRKSLMHYPGGEPPAYEFTTLPVTEESVTDGGGFAISVEVRDFHLLPREILVLVCERCDAMEKGEHVRALELRNQINETQDYEVVDVNGVEFLTRKCIIRLRGIRAPKINEINGAKARNELARLVNGKHLSISVYSLDEEKRYVADVYHMDKKLQEILLKKESQLWKKDLQGFGNGREMREMLWTWECGLRIEDW